MENLILTILKDNWLGLLLVLVLSLFLPLTTIIYYKIRRDRRKIEIQKSLCDINFKCESQEEDLYDLYNDPFAFILAVCYLFIITFIGLGMLFVGPGVGYEDFAVTQLGDWEFPQQGSRLIMGMSFLGAYVWGVQYILRRYSLNDLIPAVYFNLNIRMILASAIALVLYNATQVFFIDETNATSQFNIRIWPALAFVIGFYPERGLDWLTKKLPIFSETNLLFRNAPLHIIEGVGNYDVMRLQELGIDSCYDLAVVDFIPLLLKTPYTTRQLADWILQAKLCTYFGYTVEELRKVGIRTIKDLADLEEKEIDELAKETSLSVKILTRTRNAVKGKQELEYLEKIIWTASEFQQPVAAATGLLPKSVLEISKNIQPSQNSAD